MSFQSETIREGFPSFSLFRLVALCLVLATTIFLRQEVLGFEAVVKVYVVCTLSFLISSITVIFWQEVQKIRFFFLYQIFYDILFTSYLIYNTGINESVFLFLYILNIIHGAIIFQLVGALIVASVAGITYGAIYYVNKDTTQDSQFYTLFYNELFFFLTAILSGQLVEEFKRQAKIFSSERVEFQKLKVLTDRLVNHLPTGILQVDQDNFVVSINQMAMRILSIKLIPEKKLTFHEMVPELKDVRAKWFSMSEEDRLKFSFPFVRDGKEKVISLQIVFLPHATGSEASTERSQTDLIFVFEDISDLRKLEDKLQMESKLAAVGQLAAGIAHEIRTPLASISGSIETLLKNVKPNNPDDEKLVSISLKEIRRLDKLITEFLTFVKPSTSHFVKIPLEKVVDEVAIGLRSSRNGPDCPRFTINFPPGLEIEADQEKIKQVFLNLFMNAMEAKPGLSVSIDVYGKILGSNISIDVKDDGPGVPAAIQQKIFDPFFTTKKHGTGLGLPNVAQIVRKHRGSIRVVPGAKGGAFEIVLPLKVNGYLDDRQQETA